MKFLVVALLILAAHFSATPFAPAPAGAAKFYWPFAVDSKSWLGWTGGMPNQSGSFITPMLAGIATLCFLAALCAFLGWLVPADWLAPLLVAASIASILLHVLYFGVFSILPIALNIVILWGMVLQGGLVEMK